MSKMKGDAEKRKNQSPIINRPLSIDIKIRNKIKDSAVITDPIFGFFHAQYEPIKTPTGKNTAAIISEMVIAVSPSIGSLNNERIINSVKKSVQALAQYDSNLRKIDFFIEKFL